MDPKAGIIGFFKKAKENYIRNWREQDSTEKIGGLIFGVIVVAVVMFAPESRREYLSQYLNALAIAYLAFMYRRIRLGKRELIEKNEEIERQKQLIEQHRKEMIDSITYAKRIQDAIFPHADVIKAKLPGAFVLYKPKDIVAGDFYWMAQKDDTILMAVADCTGHGVPGAMVSVVCCNALNMAVKEFQSSTTGEILDKVTDLVLETFARENSSGEKTTGVQDGMDISMLSINPVTREVQWSGANNPLWYLEDRTFREITADKQPVGKSVHRKPFTTHILSYKPGTTFYLFTDGYADQFGGPKGKKFKYKQFQETLAGLAAKGPAEQQKNLDAAFENWKGGLEQVDDVCVIGIRL